MRHALLTTLMAVAMALGALSSSAHSSARSFKGDCCDEMCRDMPACATMKLCQACSTIAAVLPPIEGVASAHWLVLASLDQDRVYESAAWPIWIPPD